MIIKTVVEKKDAKGRDHTKWSVDGEGVYGKQEIIIKIVEVLLPQLLMGSSLSDAIAQINKKVKSIKNPIVCDAQPTLKRYEEIVVSDGTKKHTVYVLKWLDSEEYPAFIDEVNSAFGNIPASATPAQPAAKAAEMAKNEAANVAKPSTPKKSISNDPFEDLMVKVEGGEIDANGKKLKVETFSICKFQVTQAQWKAIMGSNPSEFKGDDLPVENVSWFDAREFIEKLNELTGKEYRLPKEEEWEFAARGGKKTHGYKYAGSDDVYEVAWYKDNSKDTTHPVGKKKPNELGLYDMNGNVWEWCYDWSSNEQKYRVFRGGSWYNIASDCKCSCRAFDAPSGRISHFGFRLAL